MAATDLGFAHRVYTLILAYLLLSPTLVASQLCYDPSGGLLIGFGICDNASSISLCCPVYNQCMSNGLCLNALSGNFNRGGCTDKSFNDPVCPSFCITEAFPEVLPCNSTTTSFCCDSQNSGQCCKDPKTFLTIGPAVSSADAVSARTGSTSAASSTSSATTTLISSSTTTPETSPSPSATTPAVASPGHSNKGAQVGLAVGLTLGIGAILAFALYMYRRRRRARSAIEKEDDIPELASQLPDNALNSKLFPAELNPEGEGLKGPAELDPKPLLPSRGPAELAVSPVELPAEPVDPEYDPEEDAKKESSATTAVGSRLPSVKKDNHVFPTTSPNEPSALVSSVSPPAQGQLAPAENTQPISQFQTPSPNSLRRSPSSPDQASSPQSDQELYIQPPPPRSPPSLATRPSTARTTPQSSPTRGHAGRLGKGVVVVHPNNQNWSLEEEQTKALLPKKEPEGLRRPQTISERRNVGSLGLNSSSGPWFDAYDAKTADTRP